MRTRSKFLTERYIHTITLNQSALLPKPAEEAPQPARSGPRVGHLGSRFTTPFLTGAQHSLDVAAAMPVLFGQCSPQIGHLYGKSCIDGIG